MGLYNELLAELKAAFVAEFGSTFTIEVGGTSKPTRDQELPYLYIVPLGFSIAFDPIGRETQSGHGEAQEWSFMAITTIRRRIIINDTSEAEFLRDASLDIYNLLRDMEENVNEYFTSVDSIRYINVSPPGPVLYNEDEEKFRVDVGFTIEFNSTRVI